MTTHRKVDWTSDDDFRVAILGQLGFSTQFISQETGYTPCQVNYRLHRGGVKRADYRNGNSDVAHIVIGATTKRISSGVRAQLI